HTSTRNLRACQCFNESEIPDPAADFKGRYIENLPVMFDHRVYLYYNIYFKYHQSDGPFRYLKWEPCLLFDTMFRCPLASGVNKPGHQQSADVQQEFALQVSQHAVHSSNYRFYVLPPFEAESLLDPNSYFNNVVDEDFQWIIFDIGSHKHISLLKLFINRMDLSAMRFLEVFVRGAPLPHWLVVETDFRSSDGEKGRRTEYFRRATMAEKMLWWRCEDLKFHHGVGQPQEPPVFTQTHPQFTLPLTTHDSVHPDERFLQEDWDVEACGDWGDHEGHHHTQSHSTREKAKLLRVEKKVRDGVTRFRWNLCIRESDTSL
uniref:NOT2_3_5 domain-containing protein n=1 Tax=Macrostomum lignano TaxID=282301 RepID=A0A1I8FDJ6_9PLAT